MHLYDASTNRLLRSYDAGDGEGTIWEAFSPDSRQLAVGRLGRLLSHLVSSTT